MTPEIRLVQAAETVPIRLAILRSGMPRESALFPGDDAAETTHFGAYQHGQLVGVVSIYAAPCPERSLVSRATQLRGMATLPKVRGLGYGCALLQACSASATAQGSELLWCNARAVAVGFYAKHGWEVISDEFQIPTAGPHFRMALALPGT